MVTYRKCKSCSKDFEAKLHGRGTEACCSANCLNLAKAARAAGKQRRIDYRQERETAPKTCERCGVAITPLKAEGKWRRFCSRKCAHQTFSPEERDQAPTSCELCGGSFEQKRIELHWKRFCSKTCANRFNGMRRDFPEPEHVEGARWLQLGGGSFALVDDCDFERVKSKEPWCLNKKLGYAMAHGKDRSEMIYLHRYILDAPGSTEVDHKNLNKLDYRRDNLRITNRAGNTINRQGVRASSGFRGVYWKPKTGSYLVKVCQNHQTTVLGYFYDPVQGALAFDAFVREHRGEHARLNFPDEGERPARNNSNEDSEIRQKQVDDFNAQREANRRGVRSKSGFKGVYQRDRGSYLARFRSKDIGYFADPVDAARAFDTAARAALGKSARLNFPNEGELPAHKQDIKIGS